MTGTHPKSSTPTAPNYDFLGSQSDRNEAEISECGQGRWRTGTVKGLWEGTALCPDGLMSHPGWDITVLVLEKV